MLFGTRSSTRTLGVLTAMCAGCGGPMPHQLYRKLVRPRLARPTELENPAPPTFAQGVGFGFAAIGAIGYLSGVTALGLVFTGFALAAAFLNAAFDFCLGCEVYLLIRRGAPRREPVGS